MKINTVNRCHGGQDPESFQEKGSASDVDGLGVCRIDRRPEQLGVKQACGDDRKKSASQRLQCVVLMLISGCIRR